MNNVDIQGGGFVRLVDALGSDLTVVNSARVSFAKISTQFNDADEKLVRFLAAHKHFSPFRHVVVQFHIKMPEFVARQFYKHIIGSDYAFKDHAWNEVSGRYVKYDDHLYEPEMIRTKAENRKQGSLDIAHPYSNYWIELIHDHNRRSYDLYQKMLEDGVPSEQARMILPLTFFTEFYWTASLQAIAHFVYLREDQEAQKEIRDYANAFDTLIREIAPVAWDALMEVNP